MLALLQPFKKHRYLSAFGVGSAAFIAMASFALALYGPKGLGSGETRLVIVLAGVMGGAFFGSTTLAIYLLVEIVVNLILRRSRSLAYYVLSIAFIALAAGAWWLSLVYNAQLGAD